MVGVGEPSSWVNYKDGEEGKQGRPDGPLRFLLVPTCQGSGWIKNKRNHFLNVSVYGLALGGVSTGLGRVLKDKGAQSPPRAGAFAARLLDSVGCATL